MKWMIVVSLVLNIVVLMPVAYGIATAAPWADDAYGAASPARGIVLAMYLAILVGSAALLFKPLPAAVACLLALQIAYKVTTAATVSVDNPVVVSNLAIAAFHAITLGLIVVRSTP
ncbi:hypothetical protein [Aurantiacibacter aquimixticola]|uniref:Uncharacterized protein n=1 Tax=Aurantiacibacter aquimixticola TaxID=1958945 RepID=A0A419RUM3_9SPHN|nr:hypothetical protein [Aurantiacibacter aquimixticola]RJY09488.1 hypothetical protein D6201_09060 [Aurantiacibacter aquimixticola]